MRGEQRHHHGVPDPRRALPGLDERPDQVAAVGTAARAVCRHHAVDRRAQVPEGLLGPFPRARVGPRHLVEPSEVFGEHLLERGDDPVRVRIGAAEREAADHPEGQRGQLLLHLDRFPVGVPAPAVREVQRQRSAVRGTGVR